jgi:hypothetical protein
MIEAGVAWLDLTAADMTAPAVAFRDLSCREWNFSSKRRDPFECLASDVIAMSRSAYLGTLGAAPSFLSAGESLAALGASSVAVLTMVCGSDAVC